MSTRYSLLAARYIAWRLALQGVLLFAFIPLVLFLYLRQPLGPLRSIVVGLVLMFGHRFIAAPWMIRHGTERCLWCGRSCAVGVERDVPRGRDLNAPPETIGERRALRVTSGGRNVDVAACCTEHGELAARFLTFIFRYRAPIAAAIFLPLALLLAGSLALAAGHPFIPQAWNTWQFKTIVALTVVSVSLAYRGARHPADHLRSPFPLHNLFLLGISNTLWVFRLVGAWWIVAGVLQLWAR